MAFISTLYLRPGLIPQSPWRPLCYFVTCIYCGFFWYRCLLTFWLYFSNGAKYSLNKSPFTDVYSCNILRDWIHKNIVFEFRSNQQGVFEEKEYSALMNLPLPMKENNLLSVLSYMSKATYRASNMVNLKENVLTWRNRRVVSESDAELFLATFMNNSILPMCLLRKSVFFACVRRRKGQHACCL